MINLVLSHLQDSAVARCGGGIVLHKEGEVPEMDTIEAERIGHRLVLGLDNLYFGFVRINIYNHYIDRIQELAEVVDMVMDHALIDHYHFTKSGKLQYQKQGIVLIGVLKYEFKTSTKVTI
jgi:hypothetical protein